ncbi:Protein PDE-5, partial [Aphelenchoides avenae]
STTEVTNCTHASLTLAKLTRPIYTPTKRDTRRFVSQLEKALLVMWHSREKVSILRTRMTTTGSTGTSIQRRVTKRRRSSACPFSFVDCRQTSSLYTFFHLRPFSVIGVVQMVNKHSGVFTQVDEEAFETFAIYCGLALHHAKLYDKIRKSEQKYRVALEVLAYHSVCNRDEVNKLKKVKVKEHIPELELFEFNGNRLSELEKPLYAVYMFKTLFHGAIRYEHDDLLRFVLTVRKNYRKVPYHNWTHGWTVAHAMFVFLRQTNIFKPHEVSISPRGSTTALRSRLVSRSVRCCNLSRFGPPREEQRIHEDGQYPLGCYLLDLGDGAPPLQSDGHNTSA